MNNILGSICAVSFTHILYYFKCNWKWSFIFPLLLLILEIYFVSFLPETPRWLLAKKTPTGNSFFHSS
jgi:hypothetical protein